MSLGVIIPVFNSEKYILRLLKLLEIQMDYLDEIVFVDDGSKDNSLGILTEWKNKIRRVKILSQSNEGASAARQNGLELIKTDYVTFIDSDDIIAENYFEEINKIINSNPNCDMYVLSYKTVYSQKNIYPRINEVGKFNNARDYVQSVFEGKTIGDAALWNHVYDIKFLKKNNISFDREAKIAEDCLFNDVCMLCVNSVFVSDYAGYMWICDHESLTSRCPLNMGETLNKHIDYIEQICTKYKLEERYVLHIKKWAFSNIGNQI